MPQPEEDIFQHGLVEGRNCVKISLPEENAYL